MRQYKWVATLIFLTLSNFSVVLSQTTISTVQDGNWTDNNTWSSATAPLTDYVGTLGDTLFINHVVLSDDADDKQGVVGPVVIYIGNNGVLTDSSIELGYSTTYNDVEFKTSNDANPVVIINYGYIEFGRKFQIEYDDSLYNHDYLLCGGTAGADFHIDGYICNTDTIEVEPSGTMKLHGGRLDCGGVIQVCNIEFDNRTPGPSGSPVLIDINIDTCNSTDAGYSCTSTSYGPKGVGDSIGIPDSSKISFCDGGFWPLPITLSYFRGKYNSENDVVELKWETVSEINNDFFTIMRSKDLKEWENVWEIPGAGNSHHKLLYSAVDESPMRDISYYKLKQTDFDGQFSYSRIVAVNRDNSALDKIYPIPANRTITIPFSDGYKNYQIFNSKGKIVQDATISDQSILEVDISNYTDGMYLIVLSSELETQTLKFLVEH